MALSNWDTLAVDEAGEPTNGVFASPLGVTVEIYKNWLYVRDPRGWQEGAFTEPTVMQVDSGHLIYKDVQITATRGPKSGIYCVVESAIYPPDLGTDCPRCTEKWHKAECPDYVPVRHLVMAGIGCSGYVGKKWVGIADAEKKFLSDWIGRSHEEAFEMGGKKHEYVSYDFEEHVRKIDLSKALRFNQGDAYFADHMKFEVPATEPGKAEPTVMSQMLGSSRRPSQGEKK